MYVLLPVRSRLGGWIRKFTFVRISYPVVLQPYRALADRVAAAGQRS